MIGSPRDLSRNDEYRMLMMAMIRYFRSKWRRKSRTIPHAVTLLLLLIHFCTGTTAPSSSARLPKYAAPALALPEDPSGTLSAQERELAQLAFQELLQLQRENDGSGGAGEEKRHKTHIWPYSLYERKMAKIFGGEKQKRKGQQSREEQRASDRPVVIHLPAYRNTTPQPAQSQRKGGDLLFSTSPVERHRPTNPIRPQSNRWHHQQMNNRDRDRSGEGTRLYSTATGAQQQKMGQGNSSRHSHRTRGQSIGAHSSSAEKLLMLTRPEAMFLPAGSNRQHHQQQQISLVPIQPINGLHAQPPDPSATNPLISQMFIKRIASAAPMSANGNGLDTTEGTGVEEGRRFAPPPSAASPFGFHQQPLPAPLSGSPFDLLLAPGSSVQQPNPALLSQLPNPLQFLAQGKTLEQITSLARNLIQMSNGNQDLLSSLTKAIGSGSGASADGGPASKLTSTAVQSIAKSATRLAPVDGDGAVRTLFSSSASSNSSGNGSLPEAEKEELSLNGSSSNLFNGFPAEQRSLLESAMKNGELDLTQTAKMLGVDNTSKMETGKVAEGTKGTEGGKPRLVNAESKLMEWIQQNRPRQTERDPAASEAGGMAGGGTATDKLPYYGKYCGSFVEQPNNSQPHTIDGAVWAVDERRLLVSKFHFQPLDHSENITFWAGPAVHTGTNQDLLPSENGFVLVPTKLDTNTFALRTQQRMPANVRSAILPVNVKEGQEKNGTDGAKPAEGEEEETNLIRRVRRNLYSELYGQLGDGRTAPEAMAPTTTSSTTTGTVVPIHFGGTAQKFHMSVGNGNSESAGGAREGSPFDFHPRPTQMMAIDPPDDSSPDPERQNSRWNSLEWHGGAQPLLLTLPNPRLLKTLNWLAVWDHVQKQALAVVLIPFSGAAFRPPSMVQLRPLPSPNSALGAGKQFHSGPIRILDTKTLELTEFSLRTEGLPLWFMVGKEIMPTQNGHIVPIFNKDSASVDCDSLRDFHNETVTLRLPDPLDIKDVFWFSLYSLPRAQSLSHIYIPYNDMQLPPDLLALPTPQCTWTPPPG